MNPSRLAVAAIVVLCAVVPARAEQPAADTADALAHARDTLTKWVETQQLISKEREDWRLGKEVLEQRIALIEGEIGSLDGKIDEAAGAVREAEAKHRDLATEAQSLSGASAGLRHTVTRLETKTRQLLLTLPEPIRERIEPLVRRLPADPAADDTSLGQRFQNVVGILNEINKFNSTITVSQELRKLPDGTTIEVRTLYAGLGQAWYVSTKGDAAGIGRPTPEGWAWEAADELAPKVAQAVAILENEGVPAYVPLPVRIR